MAQTVDRPYDKARRWSKYHTGIGADGLAELTNKVLVEQTQRRTNRGKNQDVFAELTDEEAAE